MSGRRWWSAGLLLAAAAVSACSGGQRVEPFGGTPAAPGAFPSAPAIQDGGTTSDVRYPLEVGGSLHMLIPPDGIKPIYDPTFISPAEAGLLDVDLIIGVSLNGDSRAYPVRILRRREMVNDIVGGVPILATW